MGEWCTIQHGKTGLTQQCRDSKLSCADVEKQMIEFISQYCPKGKSTKSGIHGLCNSFSNILLVNWLNIYVIGIVIRFMCNVF